MKPLSFLTDYKIRSDSFYILIVAVLVAVAGMLLLAELTVGLQAFTFEMLLVFFACSLLLMVSALLGYRPFWLRHAAVFFLFLFLQVYFLNAPQYYHAYVYWLPLVPVSALVVLGMKPSAFWTVVSVLALLANNFYVREFVGMRYTVEINAAASLSNGLIFTFSVMSVVFSLYHLLGKAYEEMSGKNTELGKLKDFIEAKKNRLETYQRALICLSDKDGVTEKNSAVFYEKVCAEVAGKLAVNRVSVWLFGKDKNTLSRVHLYCPESKLPGQAEIHRRNYPVYFNAIETKPYIMADNVNHNPDTLEFANNYFTQLDILSMLDCPIRSGGKTIGVLCCEQMGKSCEWRVEDALFLQSAADLLSMHIQGMKIRGLLLEVRRKNHELLEKNNEIDTMNEELTALNDTLKTMNDSLEETIHARTAALETQNRQLAEYAFVNSHMLRAPLSRILGLSFLFSRESSFPQDHELIKALIEASNELDGIVKKISSLLDNGNSFNREDLQDIIRKKLKDK